MRRDRAIRVSRLCAAGLVVAAGLTLQAQPAPRARALGVPFHGTPGPLNAITDVPGVEVGHATIIRGDGPLVVGQGPVRTGVTAVWPRGKQWAPVFAGWFAGNGFGEMTGAPWVVEGGVLGGPVMITGTYSVGLVRDSVNSYFHEVLKTAIPWHQPVVGETSDAFLNDGQGLQWGYHPFERTNPGCHYIETRSDAIATSEVNQHARRIQCLAWCIPGVAQAERFADGRAESH